jgi:sensor histidine kinase YesM
MGLIWIAIETAAVFVDGITKVYFLGKRFMSRQGKVVWPALFLAVLIVWGMAATFLAFNIPLYESVTYSAVFAYLCLARQGKIPQKVFGTLLVLALDLGSSLLGLSLASFVMATSLKNTLLYQDSSRLLALVLSKTVQIVLVYVLANRQHSSSRIRSKPLITLSGAVLLVFSFMLFLFFNLSDFDEQANHIMLWLSLGLMVIVIGFFLIYEVFSQESERILELSARLQRLEIETGFFRELDAMQSDLRIWRHEYQNNLIALRSLIEEDGREMALEYLDSISVPSLRERAVLQTGNSVLDAVVSAKLLLARSKRIDVSIQAVYPEENIIDDDDLCAIVGNLLDNAIEANERMSDSERLRFISFSLMVKGKNLVLSISNSYEGEIARLGDRFPTSKDGAFHGIGIRHVDAIVDKYRGHVLREYQNGIFETHVLLPLVKNLPSS